MRPAAPPSTPEIKSTTSDGLVTVVPISLSVWARVALRVGGRCRCLIRSCVPRLDHMIAMKISTAPSVPNCS
jgi:hypothetical protein